MAVCRRCKVAKSDQDFKVAGHYSYFCWDCRRTKKKDKYRYKLKLKEVNVADVVEVAE